MFVDMDSKKVCDALYNDIEATFGNYITASKLL